MGSLAQQINRQNKLRTEKDTQPESPSKFTSDANSTSCLNLTSGEESPVKITDAQLQFKISIVSYSLDTLNY